MRFAPLSAALLAALALPASAAETDPAAKAAFIAEASAKYGLTDAEIEGWLAKATYQQSIVNAMSRPAERGKKREAVRGEKRNGKFSKVRLTCPR